MRGVVTAALVAAVLGVAAPALAQAPASPEQVYVDNCSACHQKAGLGIPGAFPALAGDKFVTGDPTAVAAVLLYGRGGMPAFKDSLGDPALSLAASYIRSAWGNKAKPIDEATFAKTRIGPPPSTRLQAH